MDTSDKPIPRAFYIRNHSASDLNQADLAALPTLSKRPTFLNKPDYAKWCHDASTEHVFYSLVEPEHVGLRPSGQEPDEVLARHRGGLRR